MTPEVQPDPFGLDSLTVDDVKHRGGTKWSSVDGRLAAWVADMDFQVAPAIRDRLVAVATDDLGYPDFPAITRSHLPELFSARQAARFDWTPAPDRLHELCDVMQGVQLAIHHLTAPGDGVVLHTPAYHPFLSTITEMGRRLVDVPAQLVDGRWQFDHAALDARLATEPARLVLLCHPHNPTGRVFDRAELEEIAELATRHDLQVVSDEVHAEIVHPGHRHVPFAALGDEVAARTTTVTSSSKAFNLAGLRWAILHAGSDAMQAALAGLPSHYLGAPGLMAVAATDAAWTAGDDWQRAVAVRLDANRSLLTDLLTRDLPAVGYVPPEATYLAWLDLRGLGWGDDPAREARARGVELSPGHRFGPPGVGFARLNLATGPAVLDAIVQALATSA